MKRYRDITKEEVLVFTPEELYDSGSAVFCMLWDGNGKLLREEITSSKDGIYVRYGSSAHRALSSLYHQSMLIECRRLWH